MVIGEHVIQIYMYVPSTQYLLWSRYMHLLHSIYYNIINEFKIKWHFLHDYVTWPWEKYQICGVAWTFVLNFFIEETDPSQ